MCKPTESHACATEMPALLGILALSYYGEFFAIILARRKSLHETDVVVPYLDTTN